VGWKRSELAQLKQIETNGLLSLVERGEIEKTILNEIDDECSDLEQGDMEEDCGEEKYEEKIDFIVENRDVNEAGKNGENQSVNDGWMCGKRVMK